MPSMDYVIVFGDSLSDIGIKWKTGAGKLGLGLGEMTTSATGRFSDSRNWTDFMFEAATRGGLVTGDAAKTITLSKQHQSLVNTPLLAGGSPASFYYVNYAEGGACGATPHGLINKKTLGTFKDQVKTFSSQWGSRPQKDTSNEMALAKKKASAGNLVKIDPGHVLVLVWFGANDLYTADGETQDMRNVATKVAFERRHEIAKIVAPLTPHFMFMTLGYPEAATRYQEVMKIDTKAGTIKEGTYGRGLLNWRGHKTSKLRMRAQAYNTWLEAMVNQNGDKLSHVHEILSPFEVEKKLDKWHMQAGAQDLQKKIGIFGKREQQHIDPATLGKANVDKSKPKAPLMAADKVHPTDQVYSYIWKYIRKDLTKADFNFGYLS